MLLPLACGPVFHPLMLLIPVFVFGPIFATVSGFSIWTLKNLVSGAAFCSRKARAWLIATGISLLWAIGWIAPFLV